MFSYGEERDWIVMTTQVVLMNGLGIALASDSAVTAGGKVLNSSEKIFPLPAPHKAALLTSGNAEFMGIPWEVIFSAWSEGLDRPLGSMLEYRESLQKFLQSTVSNIGDLSKAEGSYLLRSYWGEDNVFAKIEQIYMNVVSPHMEQVLNGDDFSLYLTNDWDAEVSAKMSEHITSEIVEEFRSQVEVAANERRQRFQITPVGISEAQALIWVQSYWKQIQRDPQEDIKSWPVIPNLAELVMQLHSVYIYHPDFSDSNINIVGYGVSDLFPSAAGTFIHGCIRGTVIKRWDGHSDSWEGTRSFFFGQDDAISAIFKGDDWLLNSTAAEATQQTLRQIYSQLESSNDEGVQVAKEYVKQSLESDAVRDKMLSEGRSKRRDPFYKAIGMSPILDLAEFAAQLVGVQAAFAAMTQENPSVGGTVDVATISHRNGFVWIRGKHQLS